MTFIPLNQDRIPEVRALMNLGRPYIRARTESDYWLYARLFSSSCLLAIEDDVIAGAVLAFRSQDDPEDVYVQDVMTHPDFRQRGIARRLLAEIRDRARKWGCRRLYLTSEPDNTAAHTAWMSMGFRNLPGDRVTDGVSVTANFKGPGKDRAVYQLDLESLGHSPVTQTQD